MPFEYEFLLAKIFPTGPTPQKSDNAQSSRKPFICKPESFGEAVVVFLRAYEEPKKYARTENRKINVSVLNNLQNLDQLTLYIVQHINRKLLSCWIQLSYSHATRDIEGVLELVVNWIPWSDEGKHYKIQYTNIMRA